MSHAVVPDNCATSVQSIQGADAEGDLVVALQGLGHVEVHHHAHACSQDASLAQLLHASLASQAPQHAWRPHNGTLHHTLTAHAQSRHSLKGTQNLMTSLEPLQSYATDLTWFV